MIENGAQIADNVRIGHFVVIKNGAKIGKKYNCRIGFGNIPNCSKEYDTIICCDCCLNGFVQLRKGCELCSGTHIREYTSVGEGVYTAMLSHIVKDVPPFAFIRCNRNVGYSEKLREKFDLSKEKIGNLRIAFENKRSGRLKKY